MKEKKIFGDKLTKTQEILFYSAIVAVVIILIGIMLSFLFENTYLIFHGILFAAFSVILPFFVYRYLHFLEIDNCEKNISVFLNDLKEAKKSGISFPEAIKVCKGDYGKLNKYITKLKKNISWGINIDEALKQIQKNLSESKILSRSFSILLETYRSGGNIEDILDNLINSLLKIMESEAYKKSVMQQHVFMMYGIFLMFIGLVVALGNFLMPMISQIAETETTLPGSGGFLSAQSPCISCSSTFCYGLCGYYNTIGGMFGFGEQNSLNVYYKSLFFTMVLIQGFFVGIIVGQISSRSWTEGVKHGLIMFFLGLFIMIIMNLFGAF